MFKHKVKMALFKHGTHMYLFLGVLVLVTLVTSNSSNKCKNTEHN